MFPLFTALMCRWHILRIDCDHSSCCMLKNRPVASMIVFQVEKKLIYLGVQGTRDARLVDLSPSRHDFIALAKTLASVLHDAEGLLLSNIA